MSCSLSTYPTTRQVAPAAPVAALRAAADRLQSVAASGPTDTRRPNFVLDVPLSAAEVDRWERRWKEAKESATSTAAASTAAASTSAAAAAVRGASGRGPRTTADFQTAAIAYAARAPAAPSSLGAAGAPPSTRHLAPLPHFVFASVKTPPMTQLLKLRRQWLPHRQRFPVHQQRMGLLDAVLNHAVVALVGPAGSGRTLQVPIVLSETEVLKRRRLVVVSANATAARLTAVRLREERGEDVVKSRTVAAVVPCFTEANESTSVVVTTADVLLRQLLCDPCLEDVGCVVLDDAHLRSESTELCLSLLRDLLTVQQQAEQQQQQQQQQQAAGGSDATQGGAEAMRRRRLHVVLNCPDEATATSLLSFLAPARCKSTTVALQAPSALLSASTTLYLEETVQWLLKCSREGSCLVREGGSSSSSNADSGGASTSVEHALLSYAENVDVVARVMAAGDADFERPAAFQRYWLPLIQECVDQYDKADRQARSSSNSSPAPAASPLPAILVVAPSCYHVHVLVRALKEAEMVAAEGDAATQRVCTALADDCLFATFLSAAQRGVVGRSDQRWIIVATPELSQTVLPSTVDIGLVVDCARNTYTAVDAATMADTCTTEYSSITQLRYRRRLAKVQTTEVAGTSRGGALAPVVVQLIPKSVLHSAQHRRVNVDPAQHAVFRLPFHRYVQLYQVLQAREEAVWAQRAAVTLSHGGNPQSHNAGDAAPTLATRISTLLSVLLMGVPAATANKYETVRRVMANVESYLRAAAHLGVETDGGGNIHNGGGRLTLQPMGVLSLCLPVPLPVARLLVSGSLLRPSLAALTAIGALWCCSDLLSLQGVGAVHAADASAATRATVEEQAALLGEARLFFARDSLSDVVGAFHVYQMWCTVRGSAAQESDFLTECGVSPSVLAAVFETQLGLCAALRSFHLVSAPEDGTAAAAVAPISGVDRSESSEERALRCCISSFTATADNAASLRAAVGAAMAALSQEVSSSRALHACVTAALYPCCVVPTGEDGVGLLYDPVAASVAAAGGAGGEAGSGAMLGRRVATFAEESVLSDATQAVKAAGRPFLFLAKSVADASAREAAGVTAHASSTVVEQLNPLHEAAAMVFCGHSFERTRKPPLRCRGWSSVLTSSWRETRRARGLPPVSQLPPASIAVQSYDTVHCGQVVCTMDQSFSVTMRSTTARWLQQLRCHVRLQLASLVRSEDAAAAAATAYPAVGAELADAWAWWERRHAQGKEWLREERAVVAAQQQEKEKEKKDGDEESGEGAARAVTAAKAAAMRQRLFGFHQWQLTPGAPPAATMPSNAERKAAAKSAAAAAVAASAHADDAAADAKAAGEEDNEEGGAATDETSGLPATYAGKLPPADVDHIFRQCARSVAAKGTREAEARLLRDSPDMFAFLNPENAFHEYYLFLLRQAAPDMEVLGDNLEELITFLEGVESELREELGYVDPNSAEAAAATAESGGVLGGEATGSYTTAAAALSGGSMWAGGERYEVHDVVDGEGEEGDDDLYAGDGGGLQLESAAVNLKKNTGPTLAEQIEQAKRTQTGGPGTKAPASGSVGYGVTPVVAEGISMGNVPPFTAAAGASPFVSTAAGATLADKLKAMQMAAMQGSVNASGVLPSPVDNTGPSSYMGTAALNAGDAQGDFMGPQPTAADLLAVINFGSTDIPSPYPTAPTPPPQQQQQQQGYGGTSAGPYVHRAPPTMEELMALLGNPTISSPPSASNFDMGSSVLGMQGHGYAAPSSTANPLSRPPPALPAKALEERAASVLVYPIPNCRRHGNNVRLLLAKSLGEVLNLRVGPTVIVGRVARIEVPNRNVEARALALKRFSCAEQTVYLLRNDRIVDDPHRERLEYVQRKDRVAEEDRVRKRHRGETREVNAQSDYMVAPVDLVDPTGLDASADPSAFTEMRASRPLVTAALAAVSASAATAPVVPAPRIGVLSSSDDDDDNDSDSNSSSSSDSSDDE